MDQLAFQEKIHDDEVHDREQNGSIGRLFDRVPRAWTVLLFAVGAWALMLSFFFMIAATWSIVHRAFVG